MKFNIAFIYSFLVFSIVCAKGPTTEKINSSDFSRVYYVSIQHGKDAVNAGTQKHPYKSITYALSQLPSKKTVHPSAIFVSRGVYREKTLQLKEGVAIFGGFDDIFQHRDIFRNRTVLDGQGSHRLILAAENCRIDGFVLTGGRIRGKGAAIYCDGVSPEITNNIFVNNRTLAPQPWHPRYRHEIANDGGAIYGQNGAAPLIARNLFLRNATEIGRGAAIALHNRCGGKIMNNVFIHNTAGLNDPKRSSDGGAVSVFQWSNPLISGNLFLENRAENRNDSGGLFVALWSSPIIENNVFVGNYGDDDGGALFVGGQEHRYDRPLDKMPSPNKFFIKISNNTFIGNSNASFNSGAMRLTMETRGQFEGNVCAFNTGIYFQRSEVKIVKNVILDDFLCIETRKWLKPYEIINNILLGKFMLTAPAILKDNWIGDEAVNKGNIDIPEFIDNMKIIPVWSTNFDPNLFQTTIFIGGEKTLADKLNDRVVRAGSNWGIIDRNDGHFIRIWGKLQGITELTILPTYQLAK